MTSWNDRRKACRAVIGGDKCVHPGSVYDPMSARIAQHIGFEVGMFAGSTGSLTVLGAPDLIVMTLTEFAQQCLRINRAAEIPLMVDADHGYGNALSVMRTVRSTRWPRHRTPAAPVSPPRHVQADTRGRPLP